MAEFRRAHPLGPTRRAANALFDGCSTSSSNICSRIRQFMPGWTRGRAGFPVKAGRASAAWPDDRRARAHPLTGASAAIIKGGWAALSARGAQPSGMVRYPVRAAAGASGTVQAKISHRTIRSISRAGLFRLLVFSTCRNRRCAGGNISVGTGRAFPSGSVIQRGRITAISRAGLVTRHGNRPDGSCAPSRGASLTAAPAIRERHCRRLRRAAAKRWRARYPLDLALR